MRIDQFLWCIRYYKSRTIATEACKKGNVKLNNKTYMRFGHCYGCQLEKERLKSALLNLPLSIKSKPNASAIFITNAS